MLGSGSRLIDTPNQRGFEYSSLLVQPKCSPGTQRESIYTSGITDSQTQRNTVYTECVSRGELDSSISDHVNT